MKFISGLRNCHVHGLSSLVIRERISPVSGMVRIFYATPDHRLGELFTKDVMFSLAPHNHRQDVTLELLWGEVVNWRCHPDYKSDIAAYGVWLYEDETRQTGFAAGTPPVGYKMGHNEYQFYSGLLGEMAAKPVRECSLRLVRWRMVPGQPIVMKASDVHTVQVLSQTAAWVVYEGPLSDDPPLAYNLPNWKPSAEGLYVPMTTAELETAATEFTNYESCIGAL